jgi:colanic acid/amylovoran biosynthesis glycosyltransferase
MRLATPGRAQSVLIYTDSLKAPSETFVTGLIDCVSVMRNDVSVLTHWVYEPWKEGWRVNVISRDLPRWRPAWLANVAMRSLADRELFEWKLRRFLARKPYDVIHAQFGPPGYFALRALARSRQPATRLVVSFYGYDASGLPATVPAWRRRYEALFRYPNLAVVVEGPVMKARVAGLGCPEDKIHIVPLCLARPESRQPGRPRPAAGRDPNLLGFVGRFVEKKGFGFALSTLAPLLKARPRVRIVILGDGPQRPLIERLAREHGIAAQVTLKGMRPHDETLAELEGMGAIVVPSLTASDGDSEGGAPTIIAEAQIAGTPVIASDHADIPFSLSDHRYMFSEGDARSLLGAVERYLEDGGRSYDVERARARTLERHDGRRIRELYEAIYLDRHRG